MEPQALERVLQRDVRQPTARQYDMGGWTTATTSTPATAMVMGALRACERIDLMHRASLRAVGWAKAPERPLRLLHDLCAQIEEKPREGRGRPPIPLRDSVYSACLKIFTTLSVRRFVSDLRDAHGRGYISQIPHHNSVSRTLESEDFTPILRALVALSSLPLKALETEFAVDSSGFSTCR